MDTDLEELQKAFAGAGIEVDVREKLESLVASAEAEAAFYAVAAIGSAGFLAFFRPYVSAMGTDLGKHDAQQIIKARAALVSKIRQLAKRRRVLLVEEVAPRRQLEVQIDADTPPEAFARLAELDVPSDTVVRLTWHKEREHWCDPFADRRRESREDESASDA